MNFLQTLTFKELIMLYDFVLRSLYHAGQQKEENFRLVLKSLTLSNLYKKEKDRFTRFVIVQREEERKVLSLAELVFLKWEIEKALFSGKPEKVSWSQGDEEISLWIEEDRLVLEVMGGGDIARLKLSNPEYLRILATTIETMQVWDAVYPIKDDRFELVRAKPFALLTVKKEPPLLLKLGRYPVLTMAILSVHALKEKLYSSPLE